MRTIEGRGRRGKGGGGERSAAAAGLNGGWSRGGVELETTKDTCKITSHFYVKNPRAPNLINYSLQESDYKAVWMLKCPSRCLRLIRSIIYDLIIKLII